jgi:hypothetical protein
MLVGMAVLVVVAMRPMDIEFHAPDRGLRAAMEVQVPVLVERELAKLGFELPRVHAEVDHRAEKHVAADAAEDVEVKGFHKAKGYRLKLKGGGKIKSQSSVRRGSGLELGALDLHSAFSL